MNRGAKRDLLRRTATELAAGFPGMREELRASFDPRSVNVARPRHALGGRKFIELAVKIEERAKPNARGRPRKRRPAFDRHGL